MRRREFITILGGAVVARSIVAEAQQSPLTVRFLYEGLPEPLLLMTAFREGMAEAGIGEASNVKFENRWAGGQYARLPALAKELVDKRVRAIAAFYLVAGLAAKAATQAVPIVFVTGSDPVAAGLVSSLNRPEGNLTGAAFMFTRLRSKNLAMLHELVPKAVTIGVLFNPNNPNAEPQLRDLEAAARTLALQLIKFPAGTAQEVDVHFTAIANQNVQALLITADGFYFGLQDQIVALAARYRIPAIYPLSEYTAAGGLISYGANRSESFRRAGFYLGRVLNGTHPSDLPVLQATKFELVVNLKVAKTLGLIVPPTLLTLADELLE
jgi:putative ABC transport system substrate-binding protein